MSEDFKKLGDLICRLLEESGVSVSLAEAGSLAGSRADYMKRYRQEAPSAKESRSRLDRHAAAISLLGVVLSDVVRASVGLDRDLALGQVNEALEMMLGEVRDE
jgi:hypothetical protein